MDILWYTNKFIFWNQSYTNSKANKVHATGRAKTTAEVCHRPNWTNNLMKDVRKNIRKTERGQAVKKEQNQMLHAGSKSYLTLRLHKEKNKTACTATHKLMFKIRQFPPIWTNDYWSNDSKTSVNKMAIQLACVMDWMKCWL